MPTPADLFIECWDFGRRLSGAVVDGLMVQNKVFIDSVNQALLIPEDHESYTKLKDIWENDGSGAAKSRTLAIAREIDNFFSLIHPKILYNAKAWEGIPLNHWMRRMKRHRDRTGAYATDTAYRLVPKGPLTRDSRDEFASSAYSFADQFFSLSVAPVQLLNEAMPISIDMVVKDQKLANGVGPAKSYGNESVAFVPIAQISAHLSMTERKDKENYYVDFALASSLDAAQILKSRMDDFGFADIVFAPELLVDEVAADRLQVLVRRGVRQTRLIVAGSGATEERHGGMSWNEARIINGRGRELWRQRKVWQAGLDASRAKELGLTAPSSGLVMEDNQAGTNIVVADIDGFGRCIVLICQDFQANPLTPELIRNYQPDWVFVPILDTGTGIARWTHQRAYELSAISPARFLVASSTSMADMLSKGEVPCGLAIGPRDTIGPDAGRMLSTVKADKLPHGHGLIVWRSGNWMKTIIGSI